MQRCRPCIGSNWKTKYTSCISNFDKSLNFLNKDETDKSERLDKFLPGAKNSFFWPAHKLQLSFHQTFLRSFCILPKHSTSFHFLNIYTIHAAKRFTSSQNTRYDKYLPVPFCIPDMSLLYRISRQYDTTNGSNMQHELLEEVSSSSSRWHQ